MTIRICPERDGPCPHGMDCPHTIDRYTCAPEGMAEQTHAAQPEPTVVDVRVRELEWDHHPHAANEERAKSAVGLYRISPARIGGVYARVKPTGSHFPLTLIFTESLDEAKAAAQADFERRVLECLATTPAETGEVKAGEAREVIRKALQFTDWAAGEGICSSQDLAFGDPDDFIGAFYVTGDETPDQMVDAVMDAAFGTSADAATIERLTRELQDAQDRYASAVIGEGEATERASTFEAEAADLRRQLAESEARVEANGQAGIEASARYVEALWDAHTREFGVYDPSTNATEFSGASEDIDCLYQELVEGIRALDNERVDRARATLSSEGGSNADR